MNFFDRVEYLTPNQNSYKIRVKVDRLYQTYDEAGMINSIEMVLYDITVKVVLSLYL